MSLWWKATELVSRRWQSVQWQRSEEQVINSSCFVWIACFGVSSESSAPPGLRANSFSDIPSNNDIVLTVGDLDRNCERFQLWLKHIFFNNLCVSHSLHNQCCNSGNKWMEVAAQAPVTKRLDDKFPWKSDTQVKSLTDKRECRPIALTSQRLYKWSTTTQ